MCFATNALKKGTTMTIHVINPHFQQYLNDAERIDLERCETWQDACIIRDRITNDLINRSLSANRQKPPALAEKTPGHKQDKLTVMINGKEIKADADTIKMLL